MEEIWKPISFRRIASMADVAGRDRCSSSILDSPILNIDN